VQRVIRRDGLLDNVQARGKQLADGLRERLGAHPHVGDLRGRGLFYGVELVADRSGKTPFDPQQRMHVRIRSEAMARGLLVYPMGGTIDGRTGDHILLAPPFICDAVVIDDIVDRLAETIDAVTVPLTKQAA
jgi:adenosylmethionine-8-amino-7-oxononanoate aminotransferase